MKTTRKGLRAGELEKDTYGRLNCKECGESLKTKNDPDEVYTVRRCPDCEQEWKELR
ncbi:HVO_0758 family zinc finger protein [Halobellus rufus]|uniref:HVO_0758 family zinc finger protein n=1 Tax=Halobellus rufus TaxID=1448860 RepID=UPI0018CF2EE1|nr:HVO_0758 family zinc finger protein [Halobellus rufus]